MLFGKREISPKTHVAVLAAVCCLFVALAGCNDKNDTANRGGDANAANERGSGGGGPGGGPGGGMRGGLMGILMNTEAQKTLELTDEQKAEIEEAFRAMSEAPPRPQEDQQPGPAQMREQMEKAQEEARKSIESILSAGQVAQLDAMLFQQSGGLESRMLNVNVLRTLELTDEQKSAIQEAQEKMQAATEGIDFRNASEEEREKMQTAREDFLAEVKALLTESQLAKAEELMQNVPEYLQRRGGPGGPGGRPGGR